jgi:hypothetical protein
MVVIALLGSPGGLNAAAQVGQCVHEMEMAGLSILADGGVYS